MDDTSTNLGKRPYHSRRIKSTQSPHEVRNDHQQILDVGSADCVCTLCGAFFWFREWCVKTSTSGCPKYNLCCREGRVGLPLLQSPPPLLQQLLKRNGCTHSNHFREFIRAYNSMFSFTSFGCNVHENINDGSASYVLKISSRILHKIGSLLPMPGCEPSFAQLYMYDTEKETQNRLASFRTHHLARNSDLRLFSPYLRCLTIAMHWLRNFVLYEIEY